MLRSEQKRDQMTCPRIPASEYPLRWARLLAGMVLSVDVPLLHARWVGLRYSADISPQRRAPSHWLASHDN